MFLNLKKKEEEKEEEEKKRVFLTTRLDFLARGAGRVPARPFLDNRLLSIPVDGSETQEKGDRARCLLPEASRCAGHGACLPRSWLDGRGRPPAFLGPPGWTADFPPPRRAGPP